MNSLQSRTRYEIQHPTFRKKNRMLDTFLKVKVALIAASSFFSIATFFLVAIDNRASIERVMPIWLFGLLMAGLVLFNWKFLMTREGGITARKNEFNIMMESRLERIEELIKENQHDR